VLPMLSRVARTESTPPLWYALGWSIHHVGVSIVDVRLLSVLAGAGLAALVVAVGRRVLPPAAAALAGLLVAIGGEFVAHGHELRAYELLAFLTAALAWLLLKELEAPSRKLEIAIAVVVALGPRERGRWARCDRVRARAAHAVPSRSVLVDRRVPRAQGARRAAAAVHH